MAGYLGLDLQPWPYQFHCNYRAWEPFHRAFLGDSTHVVRANVCRGTVQSGWGQAWKKRLSGFGGLGESFGNCLAWLWQLASVYSPCSTSTQQGSWCPPMTDNNVSVRSPGPWQGHGGAWGGCPWHVQTLKPSWGTRNGMGGMGGVVLARCADACTPAMRQHATNMSGCAWGWAPKFWGISHHRSPHISRTYSGIGLPAPQLSASATSRQSMRRSRPPAHRLAHGAFSYLRRDKAFRSV